MDESTWSHEDVMAALDAELEKGRKELKKYLRKARTASRPGTTGTVDWQKMFERHEAVVQAIERAREAGRKRRGES